MPFGSESGRTMEKERESTIMTVKTKTRGFSLVELVIVVVIIGVIAAIAVPRISRGAKGAGESALLGSLAGIRNAIDMYAAEHGGTWPGAGGLEATFLDQMNEKTNAAGVPGTGAGFIFGPYLRRGMPPVPVGPNVGARGILMLNAAQWALSPTNESRADMGWAYNYETGDLIANTDDVGEGGTAYNLY